MTAARVAQASAIRPIEVRDVQRMPYPLAAPPIGTGSYFVKSFGGIANPHLGVVAAMIDVWVTVGLSVPVIFRSMFPVARSGAHRRPGGMKRFRSATVEGLLLMLHCHITQS